MSLLAMILLASAGGGLLSVLLASVALRMRAEWVPVMVSYAIGALLGAVFLEILPHAVEHAGNFQTMGGVVLAGILGFFILEKLVLWRHCHTEHCEVHGAPSHGHDHGRSGMMITVGDTVHNFVDGVMIAAAFLVDIKLGVVTALAIAAHEVPQELGDFLILLHSGYSKARALALNLLSGAAMLVGAVFGYFLLADLRELLPYMLAIAASGMIYVAVADLIPGLHKRVELAHTLQQVLLIGLGVLTVWGAGTLAERYVASTSGHGLHEHPQGQHAQKEGHGHALQPVAPHDDHQGYHEDHVGVADGNNVHDGKNGRMWLWPLNFTTTAGMSA
jgi:zinc and cadmium transporter